MDKQFLLELFESGNIENRTMARGILEGQHSKWLVSTLSKYSRKELKEGIDKEIILNYMISSITYNGDRHMFYYETGPIGETGVAGDAGICMVGPTGQTGNKPKKSKV